VGLRADWTFWGKEKFLNHAGNHSPDHKASHSSDCPTPAPYVFL